MKRRYLNAIFTQHALKRLANRGLSQADAWYVFQHPDGSLPGKVPGSRKFFKNQGKKRLEVIAKKNQKDEWLILSAWVRYQNKSQPLKKSPLLARLVNRFVTKIFSF